MKWKLGWEQTVPPPDDTTTEDILQTASAYRILAINKDNAHYAMSQRLERRHKYLGMPVVITSAVVSTAIFGTLQQETVLGWRIATGFLSLAAAVLAALQTFFNYAELGQKHQKSSREWSNIRREVELLDLRYRSAESNDSRLKAIDGLASISKSMSEAESNEPPILERVYESARKKHKHDG